MTDPPERKPGDASRVYKGRETHLVKDEDGYVVERRKADTGPGWVPWALAAGFIWLIDLLAKFIGS